MTQAARIEKQRHRERGREHVARMEYAGRRWDRPAGGHIADLCALRKAIVLCWKCRPRFDHGKHHYYMDRRFPWVQGSCDGCREHAVQAKFFIHESYLGGSWHPR